VPNALIDAEQAKHHILRRSHRRKIIGLVVKRYENFNPKVAIRTTEIN
jgi:hypothetical protein